MPHRAFVQTRHKDSDAPHVQHDELQVLVRVMQQMPFEDAVRWVDEPNAALGGLSPAEAIRSGKTAEVMQTFDAPLPEG